MAVEALIEDKALLVSMFQDSVQGLRLGFKRVRVVGNGFRVYVDHRNLPFVFEGSLRWFPCTSP